MDRNKNRIPAADVELYDKWSLTDINDGKVIEVVHSGDRRASHGVSDSEISADPMTAEELEALTEEAYKEGYEEGKQKGISDGHEEGLRRGQKEIDSRLAQLQAAISHLQQQLLEQDEQLETTVFEISKLIAEKVILHELSEDNLSTVRQVIYQALVALPVGADSVRIYLSAKDLQALQSLEGLDSQWTLLEDANMAVGGCRVETDNSLVDFSREKRLADILAQITDGLASPPAESSADDEAPPDAGELQP